MSEDAGKSDSRDENDRIDEPSGAAQNQVNLDDLRQALNYNWPEIQKAAIEKSRQERNYQVDEDGGEYYINEQGRKVRVMNLDSWWLDDFKREDVLLELPRIAIFNTKPWHVDSVVISLRDAYGLRSNYGAQEREDCFTDDDILAQIERFPEGQFAAQLTGGPNAGNCAGMAVTMRTSRPPDAPILPWRAAIGDFHLSAHEADGDWLYGVEVAVNTMYQRHGIGTGLYQVRFDLVKRLNLRGWYAVGMLMGYHQHADEMDVVEYGNKVIADEIKDPTVTMQMNRGFRAQRVITDYCDEPAAGNAGVLIVWENTDYEQNG